MHCSIAVLILMTLTALTVYQTKPEVQFSNGANEQSRPADASFCLVLKRYHETTLKNDLVRT